MTTALHRISSWGLALAAATVALPAQALTFNGDSIQATLTFDADPVNYLDGSLGLATGYDNGTLGTDTVTVGGGGEFGYYDGNGNFAIDFQDDYFVIAFLLQAAITPTQVNLTFENLTNSFAGLTLTEDYNTFSGMTVSNVGGKLSFGVTVSADGLFMAGYTLSSPAAPVPEPQGLALMLAGLAGVAAMGRRRGPRA